MKKRSVMSHGRKISGPKQFFLTELALLNDGKKVWVTLLFLSAIMHGKVIHKYFFFCHIGKTTVC